MEQAIRLDELARDALSGDPAAPAIEFDGLVYDWGWMRDIGERVVDLLEQNGVRRDLPIGMVARNRPAVVAALIALIGARRSVRMIYSYQSTALLAEELSQMNLAAIIACDEDLPNTVIAELAQRGLCTVSVDDWAGVGVLVENGNPCLDDEAGEPREPSIEVLTSGTTGTPRPFAYSFDVLAQRLFADHLSFPGAEQFPSAALVFPPLGTISGLYNVLPMAFRRTLVVLQDKFDLDGWLAFVARHRPGRTTLPVSAVVDMLARDVDPALLSSLRSIGTGSAPIDAETQKAFEEKYGIPLLISFGATEFGGPVTAMTAELHREWGTRKWGSAGKPWGNARLRIVDPETGKPLPAGREGLLQVVSPAMGEGWISTTDLAVIDEDGFFFHRGRSDGAISRGGFSLLPEVIEKALIEHPKVHAAAVVGLPHLRLGEVPVAAIQPVDELDPPDPSELDSFVRNRIYATHVPKQFRIVKALPRNDSMKVDLAKVRALFAKSSLERGLEAETEASE